jgi:hypothetical protein
VLLAASIALLTIPGALLSAAQEASKAEPDYIIQLASQYGAPSQAGLGSAAFSGVAQDLASLDALALEKYRFFLGPLWEKWGEAAWMGPWRKVHVREGERDIISELAGLKEADGRSSADMILNGLPDPAGAQAALKIAFDDPAVADLVIHVIGDGEAYSGLTIAARRQNGEAVCLVFLMD